MSHTFKDRHDAPHVKFVRTVDRRINKDNYETPPRKWDKIYMSYLIVVHGVMMKCPVCSIFAAEQVGNKRIYVDRPMYHNFGQYLKCQHLKLPTDLNTCGRLPKWWVRELEHQRRTERKEAREKRRALKIIADKRRDAK